MLPTTTRPIEARGHRRLRARPGPSRRRWPPTTAPVAATRNDDRVLGRPGPVGLPDRLEDAHRPRRPARGRWGRARASRRPASSEPADRTGHRATGLDGHQHAPARPAAQSSGPTMPRTRRPARSAASGSAGRSRRRSVTGGAGRPLHLADHEGPGVGGGRPVDPAAAGRPDGTGGPPGVSPTRRTALVRRRRAASAPARRPPRPGRPTGGPRGAAAAGRIVTRVVHHKQAERGRAGDSHRAAVELAAVREHDRHRAPPAPGRWPRPARRGSIGRTRSGRSSTSMGTGRPAGDAVRGRRHRPGSGPAGAASAGPDQAHHEEAGEQRAEGLDPADAAAVGDRRPGRQRGRRCRPPAPTARPRARGRADAAPGSRPGARPWCGRGRLRRRSPRRRPGPPSVTSRWARAGTAIACTSPGDT